MSLCVGRVSTVAQTSVGKTLAGFGIVKRSLHTPKLQTTKEGAVILDFNDLCKAPSEVDLSESIEAGLGSHSTALGLVVIKNVPGFVEARQALLKNAAEFASLPEDVKNKYEHAGSNYNNGWSHGKESFKGVADTAKGSYYANPTVDTPTEEKELIQKFPEYCFPNIWPKEDLPALENNFKTVGRLMHKVSLHLAQHCDQHASKKLGERYTQGSIYDSIVKSRAHKGRLLHYFPKNESECTSADTEAGWCGWHLDHGTLTGLCSAMFTDADGNVKENPDPKAGLYVKSRGGEVFKVSIPPDHVGFQLGECSQIATGGVLRATPHCVHGVAPGKGAGIARNTFACFFQPQWDTLLASPSGATPKEVGIELWKQGDSFVDFSKSKFKEYYGEQM